MSNIHTKKTAVRPVGYVGPYKCQYRGHGGVVCGEIECRKHQAPAWVVQERSDKSMGRKSRSWAPEKSAPRPGDNLSFDQLAAIISRDLNDTGATGGNSARVAPMTLENREPAGENRVIDDTAADDSDDHPDIDDTNEFPTLSSVEK